MVRAPQKRTPPRVPVSQSEPLIVRRLNVLDSGPISARMRWTGEMATAVPAITPGTAKGPVGGALHTAQEWMSHSCGPVGHTCLGSVSTEPCETFLLQPIHVMMNGVLPSRL